jgi:hypothetical protein
MSSTNVLTGNEVRGSGDGKPIASYIKTIPAQVAVTVWDSDLDKLVDIILRGNPKKKDEEAIVRTWSAKENSIFKRMNQRHFKKGRIVVMEEQEEVAPVKTIEQASDEDLSKIINMRYLALIAELNKIESIPVLYRMVELSKDLEKSSKITGAIEARMSELQTAEIIGKPKDKEEE